jgi:hypothetical protein
VSSIKNDPNVLRASSNSHAQLLAKGVEEAADRRLFVVLVTTVGGGSALRSTTTSDTAL